jgi:hypothetical protein
MPRPQDSKRRFDVFLSYASEERQSLVRRIVNGLRSAGVSVWYDVIDLAYDEKRPPDAHDLARDLHAAIDGCSEFWLVVGPTYSKKKWTKFEALTAAARVTAGLANFGIMSYGVSRTDVISVANQLSLAPAEERLFDVASDEGVSAAIHYLASLYNTRVNLTAMVRFTGPMDLVLFPDLGQIFVFPDGGFGKGENPRAFDFCGNEITSLNVRGLFETVFGPELKREGRVPVNSSGKSQHIDLEGEIVLGFMNHPGQTIYTDLEIENGTIQNFAFPLVFVPAITHGPVTVGYVTDEPPEVVRECLRASGHSESSNWSRITLSPDRNSFTITMRDNK